MQSFQDLLTAAQASLRTSITDGNRAQDNTLAVRLYEVGFAVGLTSKEITQVLMKPFAKELRPGLKKA